MRDHINDHVGPQTSWKFTDAKARLSEVFDRALKGVPQRIERSGREAVFIVAEDQYRELTRPRRSMVDLFSALRGIDLDLDRDPDPGREIDL